MVKRDFALGVADILPGEFGKAGMDPGRLAELTNSLPVDLERVFSFPFPAWVGRLFRYNETVAVYSVRADPDLPHV